MEIIAAGKKLSLILIYRAINWFIAYRDRPKCAYACVSDVSEWVDERGERAVAKESGRIKYPSCQ